jgi:hypothetical protein
LVSPKKFCQHLGVKNPARNSTLNWKFMILPP